MELETKAAPYWIDALIRDEKNILMAGWVVDPFLNDDVFSLALICDDKEYMPLLRFDRDDVITHLTFNKVDGVYKLDRAFSFLFLVPATDASHLILRAGAENKSIANQDSGILNRRELESYFKKTALIRNYPTRKTVLDMFEGAIPVEHDLANKAEVMNDEPAPVVIHQEVDADQ